MGTLERLKKFDNLLGCDERVIQMIGNCYGQFAEAYLGGAGTGIITANLETYNMLLDIDVIDLMTFIYMSGKLRECENKYPRLKNILTVNGESYIQNIVKSYHDIIPVDDASEESIKLALSLFGIAEANNVLEDELENAAGSLLESMDDEFSGIDEGNINADIIFDETDKLDDIPLNIDIDSRSSSSDDAALGPNGEVKIDSEEYANIKNMWKGKLAPVIASIMKSYEMLYKSGYGLIAPSGVLTNSGILRSNSDGKLVFSGDRALDSDIFRVIDNMIPHIFSKITIDDVEPDIREIMKSQEPITYAAMNIKFMLGHLNFCKGKYGIRTFMTANNITNASTVKMLKYSDMSKWIRESLERFFYSAYVKMGVTEEINDENSQLINSINEKMCESLKNVIMVAERKKDVNTRIRICTNEPIDTCKLTDELSRKLNIGTGSSVVIRQIGSYTNGVLDVNIIYNERSYSQDSLFAYQVLDILEEQGIRPSWDNVVLGKKDDGTIMTYNFKNKSNPTYALYAASRSGKGVMTLNLIASALADGAKLIYLDGKPDMSMTLADVAWKSGVDACVFNGLDAKGTVGLETRGNCIRKMDPLSSMEFIPDGIFTTYSDKSKFILLTTFLRGIELLCGLANRRAADYATMSPNDWVVGIVDECEQVSEAEKVVNDILNEVLKRYNSQKKKEEAIKSKDKVYKMVSEYMLWKKVLVSQFKTCITSTFGQANMTNFFVWQSTIFPSANVATSSLAKLIDGAAGNIVKIVGRGAAVAYGTTSYGTPTSLAKCTWYDERFKGEDGGFFAIGSQVNSDSMKVFRPFNVFSDANNKNLILEGARAKGLSEEDLIGISLNEDGSVIQEVGFEGYVNKLLGRFGLNAAQQLKIGYDYTSKFVQDMGMGSNILEFMYNAHSFTPKDYGDPSKKIGFDDRSYDEDETGESGDRPSYTFDPKKIDDGAKIDFGGESGNKQANSGAAEVRQHKAPESGEMTLEDAEIYRRAQRVAQEEASQQGNGQQGNGQPGNGQPADQNYQREQQEYGAQYDRPVAPEVSTPNSRSAYKIGDMSNGYCTFITPARTSKILGLNADNSVIMTVYDHRKPSMSNKLLSSLRGTKYELKSRWKDILDCVARGQNVQTITRVTICNDVLLFNKRQIAAIGLIGGEDGVEVVDIVNFEMLSKKFPNIRELKIDSEVYSSAAVEFNNQPEFGLFTKMPRLTVLSVWQPGYGGVPKTYYRESIMSGQYNEEIQRENNMNSLKRKIDTVAAAKNPRFSSKSNIDKNRILNGSKGITGASWEKCKEQFRKDNYIRGGIVGLVTVGAAIASGSIMAVTKLGGMFKR